MKLITFTCNASGTEEIGALIGADQNILRLQKAAVTIGSASDPVFDNMLALIRSGSKGLEKAAALIEHCPDEAIIDKKSINFLAPLPAPEQLRDFWAFEGHALSAGDKLPDEYYQIPLYYKGNRFSAVGHGANVKWPAYSNVIDYELELAIVIGQGGKDIPREQALQHIFGFMIFNDFSARDAQAREMAGPLGPAKGKDFDGGNAFGPCLVTRDEISYPYSLEMVARVNGEEWSRGNSRLMTHKFEDMIAHVSQSETLYPGEIFGSGTVTNGCGAELGKYLNRGDDIELEIEGIGVLSNKIY